MSRRHVNETLKAAGIPVAHMAWPKGSAPALPWMVFLMDDDAHMVADGQRWGDYTRWRAELMQRRAGTDTETAVERVISEAFGDFDKQTYWVDSEDCYMTVYTFTEWEQRKVGQNA